MTTAESIEQTAAELGITMTAEFVPWSASRNAGEATPSLNWRVTLHKKPGTHLYREPAGDNCDCGCKTVGRAILTTDYSAGCGHCPSYKQNDNTARQAEIIRRECETGHRALPIVGTAAQSMGMPIPAPRLADVLYSLSLDSEVIDAGGFEQWASDFGYDPDSRKAEAAYRACLDIALKLRAALGDDGLRKLREAVQDY